MAGETPGDAGVSPAKAGVLMASVPVVRLVPSLASAPMAHLAQVVADLERMGVEMLHFDLEDGHFVPLMTLGTRLIGELRPLTALPFDVHLMVDNPDVLIPEVAALGADTISIHYEACPYPRRTLRQIKELGKQAGLAFNPKTSLPPLEYLLPHLDFILILTTEPELPDCPFLPQILSKVRAAAVFAREHGLALGVTADGGIGPENITEVVEAGANTIVAGRSIFQGGEITANVQRLRHAVERAQIAIGSEEPGGTL